LRSGRGIPSSSQIPASTSRSRVARVMGGGPSSHRQALRADVQHDEHTRCIAAVPLQRLTNLNCDSVLCTTWRPKSGASVRKEISAQEKWIDFFKVGIFQRVMAGKNFAALDTRAREQRRLPKALTTSAWSSPSWDKKAQGEYTVTASALARSATSCATTRLWFIGFSSTRRPASSRRRSATSPLSMRCFRATTDIASFPLWLGEDHHARLSPVFAPHIGHPLSDDLDSEYLNVFETRQGTPFFQDVYVNGVRVMLIIGPPGTGKSCTPTRCSGWSGNTTDLPTSSTSATATRAWSSCMAARVDRIGLDGPSVNPFALEPTEKNIKFLYNFVKLLVTNGGAVLSPEDEDVIFKEVQSMYLLTRRIAASRTCFCPST
jgi:type IV secretion system protein VirB4